MKIVLDSNVLLSALFSAGLCEALFDACFQDPDRVLCSSEFILGEFERRAVTKFRVPPEKARSTVEFLRVSLSMVNPLPVTADACRDPDDLAVLGTVGAAGAEFLVTGDKDLLVLKVFGGAEILTPRQFYERLRAAPGG